MKNDSAVAEVLGLLDDRGVQIRTLEAEAHILLHQQNDPEASAANLRLKTELLAGLPELMGPFAPLLPEDFCDVLFDGAEDFARRAGQALSVGSVFFMRTLLYPEDWEEGEPNDLERFTTRLADMA